MRERVKERAARGAPREAGVGGPWRGWKGAEVCRDRRPRRKDEDVESGRGRRAARWMGPGLATGPLVACACGRANDRLGCRLRRAMLCRNIAAGWDLSVQRGEAKASIWGAGAGMMTWSSLLDLEGSRGINDESRSLGNPLYGRTARSGQTEALRDLDAPITKTGAAGLHVRPTVGHLQASCFHPRLLENCTQESKEIDGWMLSWEHIHVADLESSCIQQSSYRKIGCHRSVRPSSLC